MLQARSSAKALRAGGAAGAGAREKATVWERRSGSVLRSISISMRSSGRAGSAPSADAEAAGAHAADAEGGAADAAAAEAADAAEAAEAVERRPRSAVRMRQRLT